MSLETRIARRYLWAARKRKHTAFLSGISMAGLAVGVATLLVSIALLSGLQGQIKGRLMEASPQILVEPIGQNMIDDPQSVVAAATELGIPDIRPFVSGIAWGANEQQAGRPLRLHSIVPGKEPMLNGNVSKGVDSPSSIFLTRAYATSLGVDEGDFVTVLAPRTRLTPFGPVPVMKRYRVARLVIAGNASDLTDGWLAHDEAASLFGTAGRPTAIEMYGDASRAEEVQSALAARFPRLQFKTWKEINRPLFLALRLEKIVMFATISLIIFVAALNLVSSLSMLILEKRPSVGVLRTLGSTETNIRSLFMQLGLFIGLTGTVLGNFIGIGVSWAANRWHLVPLPADIYFISYLPFRLDVEDVVGVNIVAVCLSVIATWYPARIASRLDPIAAIKEE
jgi:lipoprotein-releasing system permease protein